MGRRIPRIVDNSNSHSWYARSRSRVVLGLTLTAAPVLSHYIMIFCATKRLLPDLVGWTEPRYQAHGGFLRFTQEIIKARNRLRGLRGGAINIFHVHNDNRVLAFHRWVPGERHDVIVVASLSESIYFNYELGFPINGYWKEEINSDVYDNWVNPWVVGNGGGIDAIGGRGMHGLPFSARITIPANWILIFPR